MRTFLIIVLGSFLLGVLPPGGAGPLSAEPVTRQGPADDEIVLILEVEDWVETRSATIRIAADLAVPTGTFSTARAELLAALRGFAIDTIWRVVDFARQRDEAGFERWSVTAEARVAEATLSELPAQVAAATEPGRALSLAYIDYTPTLAERQAVIDRLRARVYARVAEEIAALDGAFQGRGFRVRLIDFTPSFRAQPRFETLPGTAARQAADAPAAVAGLAGAEKAVLTARVHLAARASAP